jgi:hypothetical protein
MKEEIAEVETTFDEAAPYPDSDKIYAGRVAQHRRYKAFEDARIMAQSTGCDYYVWYCERAGWCKSPEKPKAECFWRDENPHVPSSSGFSGTGVRA